jgi:hypothetical protein
MYQWECSSYPGYISIDHLATYNPATNTMRAEKYPAAPFDRLLLKGFRAVNVKYAGTNQIAKDVYISDNNRFSLISP